MYQLFLLGSVFWTAESSSLVDLWSAFNVVILPDFNGDGVPEVLLPHSSDPRFPPEVVLIIVFKLQLDIRKFTLTVSD